MQRFLLFLLVLTSCTISHAQISWDGGGDGTSWEDAMNWSGDVVPPTDSIVVFTMDATVTGTMPNVPVQIRIGVNRTVVLDLDLTIGNGTAPEHAIILNDTCSLTLGAPGSNRTVNLNAPVDKHGVVMFGGTDGAQLTVAESTTVNAQQGLTAVNLANPTSAVVNNGTINLADALRDGFRLAGNFANNGVISGGALERDLVNLRGGAIFTNNGTITSLAPGDDGIDLIEEAIFLNEGSLVLTVKEDAGSGNSGLAVGNADTGATFVNNGSVTANGGSSEDARSLYVYGSGTLDNNGEITLMGGNDGSRLFLQGTATNGMNAVLDLTDGRININETGLFTNNGLVSTTRDGSGIFTTGTAVNNAFFDYSTSNQFAGGANGTIVDNGISLNNNDTRINAMNNCTVDIAEAPYTWSVDGTVLATAGTDGAFTFPDDSVMADSVIMTTTIPGVEIKVVNICADAIDVDTGLFGPAPAVEALPLFPNLLRRGETLNVDLRALENRPVTLAIINAQGQVMLTRTLNGGALHPLATGNWPAGMYTLRSLDADTPLLGRVIVK